MQEKLLNFFNSVGFTDEDGDFLEASISKVVLKKKEEIFEVFIENDRIGSYSIDKDSKSELIELINLIENESLKYKLHDIRKRANQVCSFL